MTYYIYIKALSVLDLVHQARSLSLSAAARAALPIPIGGAVFSCLQAGLDTGDFLCLSIYSDRVTDVTIMSQGRDFGNSANFETTGMPIARK